MDRRTFNGAMLAGLLAPRAVYAQQPDKVYRVGLLTGGNNQRSAPFLVAFEQHLRELGWIEGKNLAIEFVTGETSDQLAAAAAQLVARHVDAIVVAGSEPGLQAVRAATHTIPVVIVAVNYDPVGKGHVASLARPGGNITGVYFRITEVSVKQLELLHTAVPAARRVGVIWTKYSFDQIPYVEAAASQLGLRLEKIELTVPAAVDTTLALLKARRVDAVLAIGDPIVFRERSRIAAGALKQKLPLVAGLPFAEFGPLVAFGPDLNATLANAAEYVNKILRGANPGDLPIEQPNRFTLVINLKTAKALGLTMPQSLLLRADEVIQ